MASQPRSVALRRVVVFLVMAPIQIAGAQAPSPNTTPTGTPQTGMPLTPSEPAVLRVEKAFPTGDRATSIILLERTAPVEIRRGTPFGYDITLTNLTRSTLGDIVLTERFPPAFESATMTPEPTSREGNTVVWRYKAFPAGGRAVIRVLGSTDRPDDLTWCATVAFNTGLCATTRIVEPKLVLSKTAPAEVMVCDPIPIRLVVTNTGTGTMQGVQISDPLPQGWQMDNGTGVAAFSVGALRPGESQGFTFQARSGRTGIFVNEATATESGGMTAKASAETTVRKPALSLTKSGPDVRFIGRPAEYTLTATNTGDVPATDVILVDAISGVGEFVRAGSNGQFADGKVTWALGTLAPGASKTVEVVLVGRRAGRIADEAVVTAYCADARAQASTEVKGVAAILLEVVDVADPIEVGADETYVITVINQGTANDTNVRIQCTLPAELSFVSAEGPTAYKAEGQTVTFAPLPVLAPKAQAVFRLVLKGKESGDVRFKTSLTSDMLTIPVEETESTHIY